MDKHFSMYTKNDCVWCDKAKTLLNEKGIAYQEMNIQDEQGDYFRRQFKQAGFKTVPQIYDGPVHIGGYTDLEKYLER